MGGNIRRTSLPIFYIINPDMLKHVPVIRRFGHSKLKSNDWMNAPCNIKTSINRDMLNSLLFSFLVYFPLVLFVYLTGGCHLLDTGRWCMLWSVLKLFFLIFVWEVAMFAGEITTIFCTLMSNAELAGCITPNIIPLTTIIAYLYLFFNNNRSSISNHWACIPACSVVPPIYKQSNKPYCHIFQRLTGSLQWQPSDSHKMSVAIFHPPQISTSH